MTRASLGRELRRKAVHAFGIVLLPLSWVSPNAVVLCLFLLVVGYWVLETRARLGHPTPGLTALIQSCKLQHRLESLDPGPIYLAAVVGLAFLFLPLPAAQIGLIHIPLADAAASLAPHYLPARWKLPHSARKSWTGSLTFFLVAWAGTLFFLSWPQALLIAALGTLLESLPPRDIDNLTVPLGVALLVTLTGWLG